MPDSSNPNSPETSPSEDLQNGFPETAPVQQDQENIATEPEDSTPDEQVAEQQQAADADAGSTEDDAVAEQVDEPTEDATAATPNTDKPDQEPEREEEDDMGPPPSEPLPETIIRAAAINGPAPLPIVEAPNQLDGVPEPLRRAMKARGFKELMPVQRLVLEFAREGKNLRISSQTGSGKTVALGLALAETLLDGAEAPEKPEGPVVLIITPTRELATQVEQELRWLFENVKSVSTLSVTGGTDVGQEKRALRRRPTILVGTPGRLLDHIRSGALNTEQLGQVVLDEADRMLDMGFKDELDAIVDTLPEQRRSHLMSATFPPHVLNLANRFQGDALDIQGSQPGSAHEDINHVVYLVPPRQNYGALVNVLLLSQGARCLVFVQRRVDAADLAEKLASDGFSALPFSGDLSQTQRSRTLHAFRTGIVKTLISTDVAARGIDVPDIATVIHMDIPDDADTYVHRSGRTGRAGNKGRSLMIVSARAQRRVRFLLNQAKVNAAWLPVPKPSQVRKAIVKKTRRQLHAGLKQVDQLTETELKYATTLLETWPAEQLIATLLRQAAPEMPRDPMEVASLSAKEPPRGQERSNRRYDDRPNDRGRRRGRFEEPRGRRRRDDGRNGRDDRGNRDNRDQPRDYRSAPQEGYVRFFINWGGRNGANPSRILSHVCRRGNVTSREVGAIRIGPFSSTFEVTEEVAYGFEQQVRAPDDRDPDVYIRRWRDD